MGFTTFSAGDIIKSSEVNANYYDMLNPQIDNALLNTTSIDVMDLIDSPFKIVDLFTDSDGSNNTVDTGNTTALYNTSNNYYDCALGLSTIVLEPSFETVTHWTYSETKSSYTGEQDTNNVSDGTYSYKLSALGGDEDENRYCQILQSVDFTNIKRIRFYIHTESTGSNTHFSYVSVIVGATTIYSKSNYSSYTGWIDVDVSAISGNQDLIFRCGCNSNSNIHPNTYFWIDGIRTYPLIDSTIQSVSKSVGTGYNYAYVRPKLYEAIPSGATITCNVSLDGGSTFTAESDINEIIDISSLTDTGDLVVKMNLNTNGTVTSKVSGWACLLYK